MRVFEDSLSSLAKESCPVQCMVRSQRKALEGGGSLCDAQGLGAGFEAWAMERVRQVLGSAG